MSNTLSYDKLNRLGRKELQKKNATAYPNYSSTHDKFVING